MTETIALCGVAEEVMRTLERGSGYRILRFVDEPERRGDVKLAYFLRDGPPVELAVVGYPGAEGLTACDYLRGQSGTLPVLWLCDRREFEPEAKRLGVDFCGTNSLATRLLDTKLPIDISKMTAKTDTCRSGKTKKYQ